MSAAAAAVRGSARAFSPSRIRNDRRRRIEAAIERLLEVLDELDGDTDIEEDDRDERNGDEAEDDVRGWAPGDFEDDGREIASVNVKDWLAERAAWPERH